MVNDISRFILQLKNLKKKIKNIFSCLIRDKYSDTLAHHRLCMRLCPGVHQPRPACGGSDLAWYLPVTRTLQHWSLLSIKLFFVTWDSYHHYCVSERCEGFCAVVLLSIFLVWLLDHHFSSYCPPLDHDKWLLSLSK